MASEDLSNLVLLAKTLISPTGTSLTEVNIMVINWPEYSNVKTKSIISVTMVTLT